VDGKGKPQRADNTKQLTTGTIIATTFVGQVAGMSGFVSFPGLRPEFQRLRDTERQRGGAH
jgi:hypothetical protein